VKKRAVIFGELANASYEWMYQRSFADTQRCAPRYADMVSDALRLSLSLRRRYRLRRWASNCRP
jgi:hypothetical protein